MNLTDARRSLADWIDPGRTSRETAAIRRALYCRETARRSRPLILVSEHRELHGMISPRSPDVIVATVEQAAAGRVRGVILSGVIPTNLALQHTDYHKAMDELRPCLLTTQIGA